MTIQHTPTPWLIVGTKRAVKQSNFGNYRTTISAEAKNHSDRAFYETVAYTLGGIKDEAEVSTANAAFIVRACNAHEEQKEALRIISDGINTFFGGGLTTIQKEKHLLHLQAVAEAAIAKAEGK